MLLILFFTLFFKNGFTEAYRLLSELAEKKEEAEENVQHLMKLLHERELLCEETAKGFLSGLDSNDLLLHREISFSTHARVESCATHWMKRNGIVKCVMHYGDDFQSTNVEAVRASLPSVPSREELEQAENIESFLAYVHYHALPFFHSLLRG